MAQYRVRRGLALWLRLTARAEHSAAATLAATRVAQIALEVSQPPLPPDAPPFLWAVYGAMQMRQAAEVQVLRRQVAEQETMWREARRVHQQAQRLMERARARHTREQRRRARRRAESEMAW